MYGYGYQYGTMIGSSVNPSETLFAAYKLRVESDSGVVENNTCAITFLTTII